MAVNPNANHLIWAVREGRAKELINSFGLSYSPRWSQGYSLLCDALKHEHIAVAKLLLINGARVNSKSEEPATTPLHSAAITGDIELVSMILCRGANVNAVDQNGITPLHTAIKNESVEITELLLKHGADVDCAYTATCRKKSYTPLHFAAESDSKEIVKLLLSRGANVDAIGGFEDSVTPLHVAAEKGNYHIVEDLLNHGACIDSSTLKTGQTSLHFATKKGHEKVVKLLLQHGAKVDIQDKDGNTTLHLAVENGYLTSVEDILKNRPDINAKRNDGITALHIAIRKGYGHVVKALLEYKAKVDSKIKSDIAPLLHLGAELGYGEILKTILEFGAEIDSKDEYGRTALHIAVKKRLKDAVVTLLEHGSDINITDKYDRTPIDYVKDHVSLGQHDNSDGNYFVMRVNLHEIIFDALIRHIVKIKTANFYVSKKILLLIPRTGEMRYFQDECEEEIKRMKEKKIDNSNVSFYDVLTKDTKSLAICVRNANIVQVVKSDDYKATFSIYASMINSNFRKGVERKELVEKGNIILRSLLKNLPVLPYVCIEKLFSYLSNEDLRILISVYKPLSLSNPNIDVNDVMIASSISQVRLS